MYKVDKVTREELKMKFNGFLNVLCCKLMLIINLADGKLTHEKDKHGKWINIDKSYTWCRALGGNCLWPGDSLTALPGAR